MENNNITIVEWLKLHPEYEAMTSEDIDKSFLETLKERHPEKVEGYLKEDALIEGAARQMIRNMGIEYPGNDEEKEADKKAYKEYKEHLKKQNRTI